MIAIDIVWILAGAVCLIIGLLGSILPGLPGPPLSYVGLLLLHFSSYVQFAPIQLITWGVLMALTVVFDYLLPVLGVKQWNGTKWGNWGCIIGTLVGCFVFPPWGIIVGPFAGAVLGELLIARKPADQAFKAGFGAFVGFLFGTIFKLVVCGWFIWCFVAALI